MSLIDYGYIGNDILPLTPFCNVIRGVLLAINKVYASINPSVNTNVFLDGYNNLYFYINHNLYDYLFFIEGMLVSNISSSQNNIWKGLCYYNETTKAFALLYNSGTAITQSKNMVLQDAVSQLIDSGFQTSMLPFYPIQLTTSNQYYLNAQEYEAFYRRLIYSFLKDYFIQRVKYLSLLRIYTEYRGYNLSNYLISEHNKDFMSGSGDILEAYNQQEFVFEYVSPSRLLDIDISRYSNNPNLKQYYLNSAYRSFYLPKSVVDNLIGQLDAIAFYNKSGVSQTTDGLLDGDGTLFNGVWDKVDTSVVYSIPIYLSSPVDCYKVSFGFDVSAFIIQKLTALNNIDVSTMPLDSSYWCRFLKVDYNNYLTSFSDCFDFSDI